MTNHSSFVRSICNVIFQFKFLWVSGMNYLFGNALFALLWIINNSFLPYFCVAAISTSIASIFSFQMQSRVLLKSKSPSKIVTPVYLAIQILGLITASITVPYFSSLTSAGYIPIQFLWSAMVSVISVSYVYFFSKTYINQKRP